MMAHSCDTGRYSGLPRLAQIIPRRVTIIMNEKEQISRQQQKSRETKEKIFQAAKRILQKSGYEALSIKNICEEAGVSNGSFYHHFKTKDDLLSYYIEDQPKIDPDRLELPKDVSGVKEGIIQVSLAYYQDGHKDRADDDRADDDRTPPAAITDFRETIEHAPKTNAGED